MTETPSPNVPLCDVNVGVGIGADNASAEAPDLTEKPERDVLPTGGAAQAGLFRRGVALVIDALILVVSLGLLAFMLPDIWRGDWANEYGKASALQMESALTWFLAIVGVLLFIALIRNSARQWRTLGMRFLLIEANGDGGDHTLFQLIIITINALPLIAVIVILGSAPLTVMGNYERRAVVRSAIHDMEPIRAEVAKQGCQIGSRPAPSKEIAAVDVTNTGPGGCTITMTFARMRYRTAGLSGQQIKWTSDQSGGWVCSSDMLREWLPPSCR